MTDAFAHVSTDAQDLSADLTDAKAALDRQRSNTCGYNVHRPKVTRIPPTGSGYG